MRNKSISTIIVIFITVMTSASQQISTFTDLRDGKTYKSVRIGTQTWMAENLAYKAKSGCWVYDNDENNVKYGYLYNWETAKNICPSGWHLPTDDEWTTLIEYLGGETVAGGKIKETGTVHWRTPNTGATNETGFTALPSGRRNPDGSFSNIGTHGYWWTSTEYATTSAYHVDVGYNYNFAHRYNGYIRQYGFSVRCLRD